MTLPAANPEFASVYLSEVLLSAPRLLSALDREPHSPTYGSFDREHWAWKFRDFPITMLQIAHYPLARLWALPVASNPYYQSPRLLEWIVASMEWTLARQHSGGAFDSLAPNARDHGVTLATVYGLTEAAARLGPALPGPVRDRLYDSVRRACRFAFRSEEDYAFITNHQALFALAFHNAWELTGERLYRDRAEQVIGEIVRKQSADGWYQEYHGPDPGYESLAICYLAHYHQKTGSNLLLGSLRRSVQFFSFCVHCDGSVGGLYGSRHTSLFYPSGFEQLSGEIPEAASVVRFMRPRIRARNVLTPSVSDQENLAALCYSYLEAFCAAGESSGAAALPCEQFVGRKTFRESGITVHATPRYYAVLNAAKGGVCRIFDRDTQQVAYEDSGYRIRSGRKVYSSQLIGLGKAGNLDGPDQAGAEAVFAEVQQPVLTPAKFIVLRILNLTVFRSMRLADWIRRHVIERLITGRRPGPFRLKRTFQFGPHQVVITDEVSRCGSALAGDLALPRSWTPIHMGSAKYFYSSELQPTAEQRLETARAVLNSGKSARVTTVVRFDRTAAPSRQPAVEVAST